MEYSMPTWQVLWNLLVLTVLAVYVTTVAGPLEAAACVGLVLLAAGVYRYVEKMLSSV